MNANHNAEVVVLTKDGSPLTRFRSMSLRTGEQVIGFDDDELIATGRAAEAVIYEHDANGDVISVQTVDLLEDPDPDFPDGVIIERGGGPFWLHLTGERTTPAQ